MVTAAVALKSNWKRGLPVYTLRDPGETDLSLPVAWRGCVPSLNPPGDLSVSVTLAFFFAQPWPEGCQ
jgi:hypothetical protein